MKIHLPITQSPAMDFKTSMTLLMTGEIKTEMATQITQSLMEIEAHNLEEDVFEPIQLIINSPGGDLYSTFMICDIISSMRTPVYTIGLGQVASGGFMIFMCGKKGHRTASVNTQFMTHRFIAALEGNHANLKSQYPEFDRLHDRIVRHYKKYTGLSQKQIEKVLLTEHDVWLSAEECKQYNICDIVVDTSDPKTKAQSFILKK